MIHEPFITAADLGSHLGRGDLSGDSAAVAACKAACDLCRTGADLIFTLVEDDVITLDGTGTDVLVLPQVPVIDVTSILDDDDEEVTFDWVLTDIGTLLIPSGTWTKGRQNFTITYSHGYTDDASGNGFPEDVRMVALSAAARMYLQGPAVFESIGRRSVRYAGPPMDLTNGEKAILRKHKETR